MGLDCAWCGGSSSELKTRKEGIRDVENERWRREVKCTNTEFSAVLIAYLSASQLGWMALIKTSRIDSMNACTLPLWHVYAALKMLTDNIYRQMQTHNARDER